MTDPAKHEDVRVQVMRSQLGRARGLGSAKSGVSTWKAMHWTSIALVPLTLWFVWTAMSLIGAPRQAVLDFMNGPVEVVLMLALVGVTFHHMALGLQAVIEDYVHAEAARSYALLAMRAATVLLALTGIVSVLRMGL
jgi:succinate dehydrogenase / fumarate reductase membrane anchor subunit